jgi:hypothetical protein
MRRALNARGASMHDTHARERCPKDLNIFSSAEKVDSLRFLEVRQHSAERDHPLLVGVPALEECLDDTGLLVRRDRDSRRGAALDLIDADHDGRITAAEHRAFLVAMTVDPTRAATAFPHLDTDGDGFLSREEYVQLMEEFYTSDQPDSAGSWILGKDVRS